MLTACTRCILAICSAHQCSRRAPCNGTVINITLEDAAMSMQVPCRQAACTQCCVVQQDRHAARIDWVAQNIMSPEKPDEAMAKIAQQRQQD